MTATLSPFTLSEWVACVAQRLGQQAPISDELRAHLERLHLEGMNVFEAVEHFRSLCKAYGIPAELHPVGAPVTRPAAADEGSSQ